MKIRVENGRGNPVGMLEVPEEVIARGEVVVTWETRIQRGTTSWGCAGQMTLKLHEVIPWGWAIRLHWKERHRLVRAGLLLPYEEIIRDDRFKNAGGEP